MRTYMKVLLIILGIVIVLVLAVIIFVNQPSFGRTPRGERLERVKASPHYHDGKFFNEYPTPTQPEDKSFLAAVWEYIITPHPNATPKESVPAIKSNLHALSDANQMIWFGHSSYLLKLSGKTILVDPVFYKASFVSFTNPPYAGTDIYRPEDLPDIDYLVITHDHWDHLDYQTVMEMKDRIGHIIVPLGVGEHFEYWGFPKEMVSELDWNEDVVLDLFVFHCLPARHTGGRGLKQDQALWASFLIETPSMSVYAGGDSGYDDHFLRIGQHFPNIDLAILENGQYDRNWGKTHCWPEELGQAAHDIGAKEIITVHHSKYTLNAHPWDEPLQNELTAAKEFNLNLTVLTIGEVHLFNTKE